MEDFVGEGVGWKGEALCQNVLKSWLTNWTIKHNIDILDHCHGKGKGMKKPTLRWITARYGKTQHKSTLNRWIHSEKDIRNSTLGDRQKCVMLLCLNGKDIV